MPYRWQRMSIKDVIDANTDNPLTEEVQKWIATDRTNQLKYIGLSGHIGSGKDYVANYIAQNVERKCEVVKFATKLTEVTASILGVDDLSLFQDREWKEKNQFIWQCTIDTTPTATGKLISAREAQKIIGTDICRNLLGDNVWVNAFANTYNDPDTLYIISDLRFPNEMEFVQANNGIVVFIENLQAAQNQHQKEAGIVHSSEKLVWDLHYGYKQADYVLANNDYTDKQPLQDLLTFLSML